MRRAALSIMAGLALVAAPPAATPASEILNDADIRGAIEGEILADPAVPFHTVDVSVADGIATLSGTVDTLAERKRAVMLTETLKGVRAVVDRLEVTPLERSDEQIRRDIEQALLMDPAADSYEIRTSVEDGVASLEGTVESWAEGQIAVRVAEDVKGVKGVEDRITIHHESQRPDYEMSAEIERRLQWDARVDEGLIDVAVDDGRVTLTGTVGSAAERTRAFADAWVSGVREVDAASLDVEWWARDEAQREKLVVKSDEEIARAVKDALLYDPRVFSFNPEVRVNRGVVTLSGVVDNLEAKEAAERDAQNTVGVAVVRNHLRVRPTTAASDQELEERSSQALLLDSVVDRFDIGIFVFDGRASLSGSVDSAFDKWHAESVAAGVEGIVEVANNLVVTRVPVYRTDHEIERRIEDELVWSPFVDADEVEVEVSAGVATLTGTVDTWNERALAAANAREGGAVSVRNELKVKHSDGSAWVAHDPM